MNPEELVLRVTDLARGGAGVARDQQGRVIFIPYSAPGDILRVQVIESNKRYAQAKLIEVLEPSSIRQVPPCPVFGDCGGCQWQHLPYSLQWKTKVQGVFQALKRATLESCDDVALFPAEQTWEYRNRVQLHGVGEKMGFFRPGTRDLVPVSRCEIARPEINQAWRETQEEAKQFQNSYKVEIEVMPNGKVKKTWNSRHSASGFRQVHDEQNEKMKSWVSEVISDSDRLFDLFGGNGNFSSLFSNRFREIHCVDLTVPDQRPAGLPNHYYFHRSSVLDWLGQSVLRSSKVSLESMPRTCVILDPPREGLGKEFQAVASSIESLNAREIVSIGCDPDSWARDVAQWVKRGWKLKKMMVIDLFPQTAHVESVALLQLLS